MLLATSIATALLTNAALAGVPLTCYLSAITPPHGMPVLLSEPINPSGTYWHELHPFYSMRWQVTNWVDNGDGTLSPSDYIEMKQVDDGVEAEWFHVDDVTITIHFTWGDPDSSPDPGADYISAEPEGLFDEKTPVDSVWRMIFGDPIFSRLFRIDSWTDTDESGTFNPDDLFSITFMDVGEGPELAHLYYVSTDIVVTETLDFVIPEYPLGTIMALVTCVAALAVFKSKHIRLHL